MGSSVSCGGQAVIPAWIWYGATARLGHLAMAGSNRDQQSAAILALRPVAPHLLRTLMQVGQVRKEWRWCSSVLSCIHDRQSGEWLSAESCRSVSSADSGGSQPRALRHGDDPSPWAGWSRERLAEQRCCTCGGGPRSSSRRMKSRSLVITTTPASLAAWKITGSLASRMPTSRTATAWRPHPCALIQPASSGGSWASSQRVIPPAQDGQSPALHSPRRTSSPPVPDRGNRPGSARCSAQRQRAQGCPTHGSSCRRCRACRHTDLGCL